MRKTCKLKCHRGCEHELAAESGEVYHTFIDGIRYDANIAGENGELTKLILHDDGPFHIGKIVE